ncbi:MAG: hypothetical protein R3C13_09905 [Hyphomonas sp.]|uniref:hypothetical protein n=1 Tax=Hyphomonas sp. TaxID=87 RepID=UPI0035290728
MSAARAPSDPPSAKPVPRKADQDAVGGTAAAHIRVPDAAERGRTESPARKLQSHLESRLQEPKKYPARYVTATVLVLCLSCWLAGFWLVTSL